eukprot:4837536-Amphidinium_carterae.1
MEYAARQGGGQSAKIAQRMSVALHRANARAALRRMQGAPVIEDSLPVWECPEPHFCSNDSLLGRHGYYGPS